MARKAAELDVPARLYRTALDRLLVNEPLRARSSDALNSQSLTVQELDALESVGLKASRWQGRSEDDPLAQTVADYMALLETSLTTNEAARQLEVDPSRIRQRLRERSLYGIDYDGEKRLPRFQFERRKVVPGLPEVLAALPSEMNPLDVAEWFLSPNPDLELAEGGARLSPRQWLLRGQPVAVVVALARAFC